MCDIHVHLYRYLSLPQGLIVISATDYAISAWQYNVSSESALWRFSFHSRSAQIMVRWVPHDGGFLISGEVLPPALDKRAVKYSIPSRPNPYPRPPDAKDPYEHIYYSSGVLQLRLPFMIH